MKALRLLAFAMLIACVVQVSTHNAYAAWLLLFLGSALITSLAPRAGMSGMMQTPTLTTAEIVADLFDAFKKMIPALSFFTTDFSSAKAKYQQEIIAHVASLPSAVDHTAGNYFNSPVSAKGLIQDVPVTIDTWKDVILKFAAADLVIDRTTKYTETVNGAAFVLAKAFIDSILAKCLVANITNSSVCTNANATAVKLRTFSTLLNAQGAAVPRFGLVSSGFMTGLTSDSVILNGNYYGQRQGSSPFATLVNLMGFDTIMEYTDLPDNGENLTALFFEKRAIVVASRLPSDSVDLAISRGVPVPMKVSTQTDPESGFSVLALERLNTQSLDLELCFSAMFGSAVGKQGGSNGDAMDNAALRVKTA